ncbi:hypothetical protein GPECTOR_5g195 [Gonium pectorale]|uniref:FAD-dependent oxidoreductase 2 FAD binding domain-containing protein n=1 Tax=Gonium pectorale TaxID=33097 RepID=A0A150GXJ3_GONPE|nr:hypothetical protein GPECTOR_5g195 [Gonium pectorale]|eukprot:KXZ54090.1 hypothetical protein GPECTOR_5g195 [Gonium pectorale]
MLTIMRTRCTASRAALVGRPARRPSQLAIVRAAGGEASPSQSNQPVHVTIVGGGAAGLTAAFFAAEYGAKVTVLERTREAGKKILMSGGSRCNVLPLEVDLAADFHSESSASAVRAVFASWNLELCKAWLEDPYWGVGLDLQLEEETKKYFPSSNSSREVRDKLVAACLARGVTFQYNASVEGLQPLTPPALPAATPAGETAAAARSSAAVDHAAEGNTSDADGDVDSDGGTDAVRRASGAAAGTSAAVAGADDAAAAASAGAGGKKRGKKGRGPRSASAATAPPPPTRWLCRLQDGREHETDKVILCTGGMSFPAVGTDGTGHRLLRGLGHSLAEPYPALTPLTGSHPAGQQLAGVSMYGIELSVQEPGSKRPKVSERTALLFTHRGYSGPAVLDLSHHAVKALTRGSVPPPPPSRRPAEVAAGEPAAGGSGGGGGGYLEHGLPSLRVNWTHETAEVWDERIRAGGTMLVTTLLQRHGLRERLAEALVAELGLVGRRVCDVRKAERAALVTALTSYELPYHGHEGYKKAEVTGGGVPLQELNCATMESRLLPGLFICGECADVFGRIGGFNFYWAWVSGRLAGIGAAQGGLHPKRTAAASASAAAAAAAP